MWKKNFRNRKTQTWMLLVIVMLCTTALCSAVSILLSLEKPFQELAAEGEAAAATVWVTDQSKEAVEKLKTEFEELDEVQQVQMVCSHYLTEDKSCNGKSVDAEANLTEYSESVFGKIRYIEGDTVSKRPLQEDECMVPACICLDSGLKMGDKLVIHFPEEERVYTIRNSYAESYGTTTAYESNILIQKLPDEAEHEYSIRLYGREDATGREIEDAYREKHDGEMDCTINSLETETANSLLPGTILGAILLAVGCIMLIVCCLIINFMVRNTMIQDAKSIAIYKTIGYFASDIMRMYLIFYFVVVSAGAVLGILGANLFVQMILSSVYQNIGEKAGGGNVLLLGAGCYVLIVGFVLLVIYSIIRKTHNVKPVYALNGLQNENTKRKKKYKGNSRMRFSAFGIAYRTIMRDKKGTIGIVITSIVTIFAVNFATISLDVANTQREHNDYWMGIESSDLMITAATGIDASELKELLEDRPEIRKMNLCNLEDGRFTLDWQKGMDSTLVFPFVYEDFDEAGYSVIKGRNPKTAEEIAISYKVAEISGKDIGDYLNVNMYGQKYSMLITGIYQTYYGMGKAARLTTRMYLDHQIPFRYDTLSLYLQEGTDQEQFLAELKDIIGNKGSAVLRTDMFSSIMSIIVSPQKKALPPMTALILLIGAVNIFCIVLLKNGNNEKKSGIYKCIGYSTRHLVTANVWYVCMIAAMSLVIAVPAILLLYPSIMKCCLSMFGLLEYRVNYQAGHLFIINAGVFLVFIGSTIISSKSLQRVSVRDLVNE